MIVTFAEPQDFMSLVDNLSDLHKDELNNWATLSGTAPAELLHMVALWTDKHGALVGKDEKGRVLCMFSEAPSPNIVGARACWFLTTQAYFENTGTNLRQTRRVFDSIAAAAKPWAFTLLSFTMHPKAEKWARFLGFNHVVPEGTALRFTRA